MGSLMVGDEDHCTKELQFSIVLSFQGMPVGINDGLYCRYAPVFSLLKIISGVRGIRPFVVLGLHEKMWAMPSMR